MEAIFVRCGYPFGYFLTFNIRNMGISFDDIETIYKILKLIKDLMDRGKTKEQAILAVASKFCVSESVIRSLIKDKI